MADEPEEPRKKKKKKKKKKGDNSMLFAILGGGVLALLLCCVGTGAGGFFVYKAMQPPDLIGRWENDAAGIKASFEFRKDGMGHMGIGKNKIPFRYTQSGSSVKLDFNVIGELLGLPPEVRKSNEGTVTYSASRSGNTLTLQGDGGKFSLTKAD